MIKFMKLITGEDVVATVEEKETSYFVSWPAKLVTFMDEEENRPRIRVEPYANHVKGHSVFIDKSMVMFTGEPTSDLREYYEKTFGNLVPPPNNTPVTTQELATQETFKVEDVQVKVEHESGV